MNELEVIDIGKDAIWVFIKVAAPLMMIALVIGIAVSLFQALTQIQEMTLTFVPKILATFVALVLLMPFMMTTLSDFATRMQERIISIEQEQ